MLPASSASLAPQTPNTPRARNAVRSKQPHLPYFHNISDEEMLSTPINIKNDFQLAFDGITFAGITFADTKKEHTQYSMEVFIQEITKALDVIASYTHEELMQEANDVAKSKKIDLFITQLTLKLTARFKFDDDLKIPLIEEKLRAFSENKYARLFYALSKFEELNMTISSIIAACNKISPLCLRASLTDLVKEDLVKKLQDSNIEIPEDTLLDYLEIKTISNGIKTYDKTSTKIEISFSRALLVQNHNIPDARIKAFAEAIRDEDIRHHKAIENFAKAVKLGYVQTLDAIENFVLAIKEGKVEKDIAHDFIAEWISSYSPNLEETEDQIKFERIITTFMDCITDGKITSQISFKYFAKAILSKKRPNETKKIPNETNIYTDFVKLIDLGKIKDKDAHKFIAQAIRQKIIPASAKEDTLPVEHPDQQGTEVEGEAEEIDRNSDILFAQAIFKKLVTDSLAHIEFISAISEGTVQNKLAHNFIGSAIYAGIIQHESAITNFSIAISDGNVTSKDAIENFFKFFKRFSEGSALPESVAKNLLRYLSTETQTTSIFYKYFSEAIKSGKVRSEEIQKQFFELFKNKVTAVQSEDNPFNHESDVLLNLSISISNDYIKSNEMYNNYLEFLLKRLNLITPTNTKNEILDHLLKWIDEKATTPTDLSIHMDALIGKINTEYHDNKILNIILKLIEKGIINPEESKKFIEFIKQKLDAQNIEWKFSTQKSSVIKSIFHFFSKEIQTQTTTDLKYFEDFIENILNKLQQQDPVYSSDKEKITILESIIGIVSSHDKLFKDHKEDILLKIFSSIDALSTIPSENGHNGISDDYRYKIELYASRNGFSKFRESTIDNKINILFQKERLEPSDINDLSSVLDDTTLNPRNTLMISQILIGKKDQIFTLPNGVDLYSTFLNQILSKKITPNENIPAIQFFIEGVLAVIDDKRLLGQLIQQQLDGGSEVSAHDIETSKCELLSLSYLNLLNNVIHSIDEKWIQIDSPDVVYGKKEQVYDSIRHNLAYVLKTDLESIKKDITTENKENDAAEKLIRFSKEITSILTENLEWNEIFSTIINDLLPFFSEEKNSKSSYEIRSAIITFAETFFNLYGSLNITSENKKLFSDKIIKSIIKISGYNKEEIQNILGNQEVTPGSLHEQNLVNERSHKTKIEMILKKHESIKKAEASAIQAQALPQAPQKKPWWKRIFFWIS